MDHVERAIGQESETFEARANDEIRGRPFPYRCFSDPMSSDISRNRALRASENGKNRSLVSCGPSAGALIEGPIEGIGPSLRV